MSKIDNIFEKYNMTKKGVAGVGNLFSRHSISLFHRLTNFSKADLDGIAKIKDCIDKDVAFSISSSFYDYMMTIGDTRKILLSKPKLLEQLKLAQSNYVKQLFALTYDEKYFINRIVVGFAHYTYKIPLSIYIGAYGYYNVLITSTVVSCCKKKGIGSDESIKILNAVQKLLFVDIALATEAYHQKTVDNLRKMENDSIGRLIVLSEYRDEDTGNHIARMSHYSGIIAKELTMDNVFQEEILYAAPMHDIGKIGIPDNILLKPGRLTKDEFEIMKSHAEMGYNVLKNSESHVLQNGAMIALSHHENFDGSGYPKGLAGEQIPIMGRICKIADVFDALINKRIYKAAYSTEETLRIMKDEMKPGKSFDPQCFGAFLKGIDKILHMRQKIDSKNY